MAEYRRAVGSRIWHWRPVCTDYPTKAWEISKDKPTARESCPECGVRD